VSAPVTLAIVTAGPVAAALISDRGEFSSTTDLQALSGALRCVLAALADAGAALDDVGLVAVCTGPGSFTGLRIGVALAKSIAQARELPMVGVSSYDIVDFCVAAYPRAALVEGKRDFFYARLASGPSGAPAFASGSRASLEDALATYAAASLADVLPGEQALRVARIGRSAEGTALGWQGIDIDYGGRPNAVVNWERRQGAKQGTGQGGGAANASNLEPR